MGRGPAGPSGKAMGKADADPTNNSAAPCNDRPHSESTQDLDDRFESRSHKVLNSEISHQCVHLSDKVVTELDECVSGRLIPSPHLAQPARSLQHSFGDLALYQALDS